MDITTWDGIIIGSAGGFIAGVAVWLTNLIWEKIIECRDKKRIYNWLYKVTKNEEKKNGNGVLLEQLPTITTSLKFECSTSVAFMKKLFGMQKEMKCGE
ncbi:MAG: hypothetical protein MPEBLZ_00408 [Candidatus Methanoperedens nitroreducens]|uniref:Uncharacterized protein n=1 Tax=Candidatus Methanoperedens nitratireducens TaxID=1392998 RepID=A0A0P8CN16_9EURY|nr:MAG: hypothetical protein MPEBLZ_00408 [Candidatus Methanoperedens sp. BLZ1]MCX9089111.1 hypothetical protein [Candidatus Methanoperedens sp.]CAG0986784.1 hypothetical protein METP2_02322 [Methanosarcinales archaeon]